MMRLTQEQMACFDRQGFLVLENLFSPEEVEIVRARLPDLFAEDTPANVREMHGEDFNYWGSDGNYYVADPSECHGVSAT